MQKIWIKYNQVFDALSNRSRILLLGAILVIVLILWLVALWQPTAHKNQETKTQIGFVSQEITVLQKQIVLNKERLENLKQRVKSLASNMNDQLQETDANALPQKIVDTLKKLIIETRSNLNIVSFEASPVKATTLENSTQKLLEHDMTLKLIGDYFATMSYIKSIEKLNWPIYWNYLSYKVTQYPQAEITLKIHTVSIQEE